MEKNVNHKMTKKTKKVVKRRLHDFLFKNTHERAKQIFVSFWGSKGDFFLKIPLGRVWDSVPRP